MRSFGKAGRAATALACTGVRDFAAAAAAFLAAADEGVAPPSPLLALALLRRGVAGAFFLLGVPVLLAAPVLVFAVLAAAERVDATEVLDTTEDERARRGVDLREAAMLAEKTCVTG